MHRSVSKGTKDLLLFKMPMQEAIFLEIFLICMMFQVGFSPSHTGITFIFTQCIFEEFFLGLFDFTAYSVATFLKYHPVVWIPRRNGLNFENIVTMHSFLQLMCDLGWFRCLNAFCTQWGLLINALKKEIFPNVPHNIWVIITVYPVPILCWNIKSGRVEIAEFSTSYCRMAFWWIDGDLMECVRERLWSLWPTWDTLIETILLRQFVNITSIRVEDMLVMQVGLSISWWRL